MGASWTDTYYLRCDNPEHKNSLDWHGSVSITDTSRVKCRQRAIKAGWHIADSGWVNCPLCADKHTPRSLKVKGKP